MGIGSVVTLRATLGCGDNLLFSDVEDRSESIGHVDLHVVSVVKQHPNADVIRCIRANIVTKTITVPYNTINFHVFNADVQSAN